MFHSKKFPVYFSSRNLVSVLMEWIDVRKAVDFLKRFSHFLWLLRRQRLSSRLLTDNVLNRFSEAAGDFVS